ncbi:prisilkin-39-like [Penaeus monodon]|uniref:prisilkin-39-like n=1 Tax=Penaeus monodon TaxID=6687 RepID=UPI0018A6E330|nr:prisilkin-39-like [Penaeus monodon]
MLADLSNKNHAFQHMEDDNKKELQMVCLIHTLGRVLFSGAEFQAKNILKSRYGDSTTNTVQANPSLNNYSQDYTGGYTQDYSGGYAQDYSGGYAQDYSGGYTQGNTGGYSQDYNGGYAQDYSADNYYGDPNSGTEYNNNYSTYDTYSRPNPSFQYNAETGGQDTFGNYDSQGNNSTYLDNYPEYDFATDGNSYNSYVRQNDSLRQEGDDFTGETETKGAYPTYDSYGASRPQRKSTKLNNSLHISISIGNGRRSSSDNGRSSRITIKPSHSSRSELGPVLRAMIPCVQKYMGKKSLFLQRVLVRTQKLKAAPED